ncbi:acetate/propionate family kinase [Acidicapsa ligni]|uniref:acetate/propionate family kinase n=1 Tax=Acidicapsa ligni TaxID=542300 RepID=UPI0021E0072A|nr:acetate/propionate family kinase [Acidicapsa ligni]
MHILVLNSGSSSIKFAIYDAGKDAPCKLLEGAVDGIGADENKHEFWIKSWQGNDDGKKIVDEKPDLADTKAAFGVIGKAINQPPFPRPTAVGHRMVNGGPAIIENQRLTPQLVTEMERYTNFAPLHIPTAIYIMRQSMELFPDVPNFVCLDNYFHRDLPEVTRHLPIPDKYTQMGLRRFGAHGLSYESIVAHLQPNIPARLIVAHLGNGASVCAIRDGKSLDTSMGLTPTGGILSGTRTGDMDPGVLLFLLRKVGETCKDTQAAADQLEEIVDQQSGLQGLSQSIHDMRTLREAIDKGDAKARLAVDEFVYVLRKFIGGYIAVLGGLDMLVFTGGIGEHDNATRAEVCAGLEFLGIVLDAKRNESQGEATISAANSAVEIRVIPAAEDLTIVYHVRRLMDEART